jgi:hypothetical protein
LIQIINWKHRFAPQRHIAIERKRQEEKTEQNPKVNFDSSQQLLHEGQNVRDKNLRFTIRQKKSGLTIALKTYHLF